MTRRRPYLMATPQPSALPRWAPTLELVVMLVVIGILCVAIPAEAARVVIAGQP